MPGLDMLPPVYLWHVNADIRPLPGGYRNRVYRTVGLQRDLVFKTTRRSENSLRWLGPVQDFARQAGFIVPKLIPTREGRLSGAGWTCEPFVKGKHGGRKQLSGIANRLRAFHCLAESLPQRPGFLHAAGFVPGSRAGDTDLARMPQALAEQCLQAWRVLDGLPIRAIHGDINSNNLIWTASGEPALIDWDEARVDASVFDIAVVSPDAANHTPELELALKAWEIACSWLIEPNHARQLATDSGFAI